MDGLRYEDMVWQGQALIEGYTYDIWSVRGKEDRVMVRSMGLTYDESRARALARLTSKDDS